MTTTQIPSSESTVSTFSRTCDRLLQQLLQNAEASLLFDARARDQAENNLERFRIWGNNIAAFKTPRSTASLEYRLRDAPQVLDRFKSRLQELIDSSTQACAIVAGDQPNREDSSTQILNGQAPRTTELDELFLTLQSSIDGLFRLSMAIRERRPQGKLPARKPVSADADLYLPRDRNHITDKYPKTKHSPWLVERLVNSIAKRRAYILDRQRHMEGLKIPVNYERDSQSVIDRERALSTIATTFEDPAVAPPPPPEHLEGHKVRRSSMAWSTVTTLATRPGPHGDEEFYVPDLSNLVFNGVQLQ
ncbi:hypothetical protein BKA61DRAFT_343041 [Leptodontidium sp. MPI-SDFR-AT-0119]|nr:hypothetical protein BKA61DRAFT_343041 [Leptodontidium sp. MPI-SDFR-AT-0119]